MKTRFRGCFALGLSLARKLLIHKTLRTNWESLPPWENTERCNRLSRILLAGIAPLINPNTIDKEKEP